MKINLKFETGESCFFTIFDESEYLENIFYLFDDGSPILFDNGNRIYVNFDNLSVYEYTYFDTVSIIVENIKHFNNKKDIQYLIVEHRDNNPIKIDTKYNGVFDLNYLIIPTKFAIENRKDLITDDSKLYYYDNGKVYNLHTNKPISIQDLIKLNTKDTNIEKESYEMTSICILKNHFKNICEQIYQIKMFHNTSLFKLKYRLLVHVRDTLWTFINLISYYTDTGNMYEALRLIENYEYMFQINNFNNYCNDSRNKCCN